MPPFNRVLLLGLAAGLTLAVSVSGLGAQSTHSRAQAPPMRTDAIARVARLRASAVVSVHTLSSHALAPDPSAIPHSQEGLGSGVVIDSSGLIVTNAHVVDGADAIHIRTPDGDDVEATLIGADPDVDLALLRASDAKGLRPAPLGNSERLRVGDWVVAIGNPLGLHHTVTAGIVSATARAVDDSGVEYVQTDAAINPGSSGGPLLDLAGRVVGINVGILSPRGVNVGLNVAIPVSIVKEVLPHLRAGSVVHGWIGVVTAPLSLGGAARRKLSGGLVAIAITEDGPANRAGLLAGDILLGFADDPSLSLKGFYRHIRRHAPGAVIHLIVWRNGQRLVLPVEVGRKATPGDLERPSIR